MVAEAPESNSRGDGFILLGFVVASTLLFQAGIAVASSVLPPGFQSIYRDLGQKLPVLTQFFMTVNPVAAYLVPLAMIGVVGWTIGAGRRAQVVPLSVAFALLSASYAVFAAVAYWLPCCSILRDL
ncbi:MAG: hypothetical protein KC729_15765 [Candidatus Eisenbacteria bacterium]|uniref:Uncharacterized protein n=1 Tax=Eiseniibacteriota bacterium TaxID=2212470 RepID=A0A956RR28_UNCEI|nr:hypothetical protein [Candidatus Eisenbacteria bacterium]